MGNKYRDPQSPNEAILQNILGEENELREPRSVTEYYLQEILKQGGGGTEVVANPELAGTETDLTGLQVGETKYKVEQPVNVEANPTLAGTEADLTGLQIGDTKYKVPSGGGGGGKYRHNITFTRTGIFRACFSIISSQSSPYTTFADVAAALYNAGFVDALNLCDATGYSVSASKPLYGAYSSTGESIVFMYDFASPSEQTATQFLNDIVDSL